MNHCSPIVIARLQQLLQTRNALIQPILLETPDLSFRSERLMKQLNGVGLLIHNDLEILLSSRT
jgi:hypothetical protein